MSLWKKGISLEKQAIAYILKAMLCLGICLLGFQWHIVHRLFGKRKNNKQRLLLGIIRPIERWNYKKTASLVEEKLHLFARRCTSSQIDENDGKNHLITLRIAFPPIFFPDMAPCDFSSIKFYRTFQELVVQAFTEQSSGKYT